MTYLVQRADAVELLLRRIVQRALAGSLVTGAAACTGCLATDEPPVDQQESEGVERRVEGARARERSDKPPRDAATAPVTVPGTDAGVDGPNAVPGAGVSCPDGAGYPVRAAGLKPALAVDYVAIREVHDFGGPPGASEGGGWTRTDARVLSESGEACATATTPACSAQVARHPSAFARTLCTQTCVERSLVTTRGDKVERWTYPADVLTLLGPIDSADEALLLVSLAGYQVTCDEPAATSVREADDGFEVIATRMTKDCAPIVRTRYRIHVARSGELNVLASDELSRDENACVGRKAVHVTLTPSHGATRSLGDYLAHSAQLETASVYAFELLAHELEAHGAPMELVRRAREARADEVRHARMVADLARTRGGMPTTPRVREQAVRSLEEIALENAVEGCVRETYGALVGAHQAERADDRSLARAMEAIAADEARHASLSHAVHAWIMGQLPSSARERVWRAQVRAIGELACESEQPVDEALRSAAGLPTPAVARQLIDELARDLWLPSIAA